MGALAFFSATDHRITTALSTNYLRIEERTSRFGGTFFALYDEDGLICVANDAVDLGATIARACNARDIAQQVAV